MGWFPRWSPDGTRIFANSPGLWQTQWLDNNRTIAHNGTHLVIDGVVTTFPALNELTAAARKYAGWNPFAVTTSWGIPPIAGAGSPALNPDGGFFYTDDRQATTKNLIWYGQGPIARGGIAAVRASRQAVVWGHGRIGCVLLPRLLEIDVQVLAEEFFPVSVDTPEGPWILSQTHTGFILRPADSVFGYRYIGQAFAPDGTCVNGIVKVVYTDSRGVEDEQHFNVASDPRIDLRARVTPPPPPPIDPDPKPMPERHHLDVVQRIAKTIPHEQTLAYAWKLITAVAYDLKDEGCGLHERPASGENVVTVDGQTYGASRVMYRDGDLYKLVSDAGDGGANGPQWVREEAIDPARWRPPLKPDTAPVDPVDPPPPGHTLEDLWRFIVDLKQMENIRLEGIERHLTGLEARLTELRAEIDKLKQAGGAPVDLIVEGRTHPAGFSYLSHSHVFTGTVTAKPKVTP